MMHCLGERALFSSLFVAILGQFLPSKALKMLYNIRYWWFFLSQSNWWIKYFAHPKIWRPKPGLLMFVSLVVLDGFHQLLFTKLTADLSLEWSGGSMFHPLSHVYTKTPFCWVEIIANNALNCWHVVFDWRSVNTAPTLNTAFSLTNVHVKMVNTLPSDIFNSSTISCNFNLPSAKMSLWSFLVFSRTTVEFGWPEHSASFVYVWLRLKSAYHLLIIVSNEAESE